MASDGGHDDLDLDSSSDVELFDDSEGEEIDLSTIEAHGPGSEDEEQQSQDDGHLDPESSFEMGALTPISHTLLVDGPQPGEECSGDIRHHSPPNAADIEGDVANDLSLPDLLSTTQELVLHLQGELDESALDELTPNENHAHKVVDMGEYQKQPESDTRVSTDNDSVKFENVSIHDDIDDLECVVASKPDEGAKNATLEFCETYDGGAQITMSTINVEDPQHNIIESCKTPQGGGMPACPVRREPYSVSTVFPIIYEAQTSSSSSKVIVAQDEPVKVKNVAKGKLESPITKQRMNSAVGHVQERLLEGHTKEHERYHTNKQFTLQMSILESDKARLAARNSRLQNQLKLVTSELQRATSEMARLTTENKLLASKVPQLQAELLQESNQADEGRSQSLQAQLSISQLKARSQVLQTRNATIEASNAKLSKSFREAKQDLRRKVGVIDQQVMKISEFEILLHDLKTKHTDEIAKYKMRLAQNNNQHQRELSRLELEWERKFKEKIATHNQRLSGGLQIRRGLETQVHQFSDESRELRSLLSTATRQVADLTNELKEAKRSTKKSKNDGTNQTNESAIFRASSERNKRSPRQHHSKQVSTQVMSPNGNERRFSSRSCTFDMIPRTFDTNDASTMTSERQEIRCQQCSKATEKLCALRLEVTRLRTQHSQELKAQAMAMESILNIGRPVQIA